MTDKELRRLGRAELLEMLLNQSKEVERLREQLETAQAQLQSRKLHLEEAGNLAEAVLRVNHIFEAAQNAADQYLENIADLNERQNTEFALAEAESRERAEKLLRESREEAERLKKESSETAEKLLRESQEEAERLKKESSETAEKLLRETQERCNTLESETEKKCEKMTEKAEADAKEYWEQVSQKLEDFYASHAGLQELLSIHIPVK